MGHELYSKLNTIRVNNWITRINRIYLQQAAWRWRFLLHLSWTGSKRKPYEMDTIPFCDQQNDTFFVWSLFTCADFFITRSTEMVVCSKMLSRSQIKNIVLVPYLPWQCLKKRKRYIETSGKIFLLLLLLSLIASSSGVAIINFFAAAPFHRSIESVFALSNNRSG